MAELTDYTIEQLRGEIAEKRTALRSFRFGEAGSRTRNVREGRNIRKSIARLLTELRAREIASRPKAK